MILQEIDLFKGIDPGIMNEIANICSDENYAKDTEIGRAHVWTPVTFLYLVCRLLLEKKKTEIIQRYVNIDAATQDVTQNTGK